MFYLLLLRHTRLPRLSTLAWHRTDRPEIFFSLSISNLFPWLRTGQCQLMIGGNRGKSTLKLINAASEYLYNSIIRRCFKHIPEYQDNIFCLSFLFVELRTPRRERNEDDKMSTVRSQRLQTLNPLQIWKSSTSHSWKNDKNEEWLRREDLITDYCHQRRGGVEPPWQLPFLIPTFL